MQATSPAASRCAKPRPRAEIRFTGLLIAPSPLRVVGSSALRQAARAASRPGVRPRRRLAVPPESRISGCATTHGLSQVTPLGTLGVAVEFAVNPNEVLAPAARTLFQFALFMVASDPAVVRLPFQALLIVSPSASTQLTVQLYMVDVVGLVTVTWAWKPPG